MLYMHRKLDFPNRQVLETSRGVYPGYLSGQGLLVAPNCWRTAIIGSGIVPAAAMGTSNVIAPPCELIVSTRSRSNACSNLEEVPAPHPSLNGNSRCQITPDGDGKFSGVNGLPIPFLSRWWKPWFSPEVNVWCGHNFPSIQRDRICLLYTSDAADE